MCGTRASVGSNGMGTMALGVALIAHWPGSMDSASGECGATLCMCWIWGCCKLWWRAAYGSFRKRLLRHGNPRTALEDWRKCTTRLLIGFPCSCIYLRMLGLGWRVGSASCPILPCPRFVSYPAVSSAVCRVCAVS